MKGFISYCVCDTRYCKNMKDKLEYSQNEVPIKKKKKDQYNHNTKFQKNQIVFREYINSQIFVFKS